MNKECIVCKNVFVKRYTCSLVEWEKAKFCSITCKNSYQKTLTKSESPFGNYKGGTLSKAGYIVICIDGVRKYQHRDIMEKHIGRSLEEDELVHHINHDRKDNRIENLQLVKKSEHSKIHAPKGSYIGRNKTVYID